MTLDATQVRRIHGRGVQGWDDSFSEESPMVDP